MEGLPAAMLVAGHAGPCGCFALSALILADITRLHTDTQNQESSFHVRDRILYFGTVYTMLHAVRYLIVALVRHRLKDDGLHS